MLIGRQLRENELGKGWADSEPAITEEDKDRIRTARTLGAEGYLFLADPLGDLIDDSFCVITPNRRVLTLMKHTRQTVYQE